MDPGQLMRLDGFRQKVEHGELTATEARAMYRTIEQVRQQSDYYERTLIRYLKWSWPWGSRDLYWREIAGIVGVASKQGAHQRWHRLIGPRPGGEANSGSAKPLQ